MANRDVNTNLSMCRVQFTSCEATKPYTCERLV